MAGIPATPAGLTRSRWAAYEQHTSAKDNEQGALLSAAVLDLLDLLLRSDEQTRAEGVIAGFQASGVSGTMDSLVQPGAALLHSLPAQTALMRLPSVALALSRVSVQLAHDPGSVLPRIDAIDLTTRETSSRSEIVQIYDPDTETFSGQSSEQETRNDPRIYVSKGTPASVPSAPLQMGGTLRLATVLIPAGATSLDSATYTDTRDVIGRLGQTSRIRPWAAAVFTGDPVVEVGEVHNVASIVRVSAGVWLITLTEAVPAGLGRLAHVTAHQQALGVAAPVLASAVSLSASTIAVYCWSTSYTPFDPAYLQVRLDAIRS